MDSEKTGNNRTVLWLALVASLVLHALIIRLPGMQSSPSPNPLSLDIELVFVDALEPEPEPKSEPPPPEPEERMEPEPAMASPEPTPVEIIDATPESIASERPEIPAGQRLLEQVRINHSSMATPDFRNRLQGAAVPRLPGQPGWLNDHVGPVNARRDQWREADGGYPAGRSWPTDKSSVATSGPRRSARSSIRRFRWPCRCTEDAGGKGRSRWIEAIRGFGGMVREKPRARRGFLLMAEGVGWLTPLRGIFEIGGGGGIRTHEGR